MEPGLITFVFDGDTFVGHFRLRGDGHAAMLTVWYKHVHAAAQVNGLKPETVARVLLGELVRDDLAGQVRPARHAADPRPGAAQPERAAAA